LKNKLLILAKKFFDTQPNVWPIKIRSWSDIW